MDHVDAGIVCATCSASYLDTLAQRFAGSAGLEHRAAAFAHWRQRGTVFTNLRCLRLRPCDIFINVDGERFPVIENLTVHFNGGASLHVNSLTLRALHVIVPGKNEWGLLSLYTPNLELFVFVGCYNVCCQGARAVADTRVRLSRLNAFRWVREGGFHEDIVRWNHAQLDGMVQCCEGSAKATHKTTP